MENLVYDLCCGTGGWTDAFLAENYQVIGIDVKQDRRYKGQFILADVRALQAASLAPCQLIVASPPCQEFSHARAPFLRRDHKPDLSIIQACFRLAAEKRSPIVLENVHGLQKWIGPAIGHYGKFYLWGDGVPALLPAGPSWKTRQKMLHRSPLLRARIPDELALSIARFHKRVPNCRAG